MIYSGLKKCFLSGLLFWIPVIVTALVIKLILGVTIHLIEMVPQDYLPDYYLHFSFPGANVVIIILFILISGLIVNHYIGKKLLSWWEHLLSQIPLIRSIYYGIKQSMAAVMTNSAANFQKVVLVEYPRKDMWSLAFLTNEDTSDFEFKTDEDLVAVYVPTTPNPTSGYIVLVPKQDIRQVSLTAEQSIKWIISLGIINPKDKVKDIH